MNRVINIAALLFFAWAIAAGVERLYWVNAGGGLAGGINVSETRKIGIDCSRDVLLEVKRLPGGLMAWRCGQILPFADTGKSAQLEQIFDGLTTPHKS